MGLINVFAHIIEAEVNYIKRAINNDSFIDDEDECVNPTEDLPGLIKDIKSDYDHDSDDDSNDKITVIKASDF